MLHQSNIDTRITYVLEPMRVDRGKHWRFAGIRHSSTNDAADGNDNNGVLGAGRPDGEGALGVDGTDGNGVGADPDVLIITDYLHELGYLAHDLNKAALANMCRYVLKGGGQENGLKDKVIHTILWQEFQDCRVGVLIKHLEDEKLIGYEVDPETAASALDGYVEDVVLPIVNRFNETPDITGLQIPPMSDDCIDVFYEDTFQRLVNVVACNQLLQPKTFNIDKIHNSIVEFLQDH